MLTAIRTVLLVEDDPSHAIPVELLLQDLNIPRVLTAADAEAAAALASQHRVDLVLCDLSLPGRDGVSLLHELSRLPYRPRIVILSSMDDSLLELVSRMALDMGMRFLGAVVKPLSSEALLALLARQPPADGGLPSPQPALPPAVAMSDAVLQRALDQQSFDPFFEARINRATGKVEGVEILARMRLLGAGIVLPAQFIGQLEAMDRIAEMTWQIAGKAFAQIRQWRDEGLPLTVSLNISPMMLGKVTLIDQLVALVTSHGLSCRDVTLEITESAAIAITREVTERLVRLRLRGFGLSIDDFGTGFASLSQLSKVPFTEMKLDRSFITNVLTDLKARAVLESSIGLARRLKLGLCAEGVETQAMFRVIHDLQVDFVQGHYFHRPMAGAEFARWARDWNLRSSMASLYGEAGDKV